MTYALRAQPHSERWPRLEPHGPLGQYRYNLYDDGILVAYMIAALSRAHAVVGWVWVEEAFRGRGHGIGIHVEVAQLLARPLLVEETCSRHEKRVLQALIKRGWTCERDESVRIVAHCVSHVALRLTAPWVCSTTVNL